MKIIDVFNLMAKGKIEYGAKLKVFDIFDEHEYEYINDIQTFRDEEFGGFYKNFSINSHFLNLEVELIPPKPKKYYLRLDEDDKLSYINLNKYASYEIAGKNEYLGYKTKFTQEEIDNDKFLKFVEEHGIKEEVEE